MRKILNCKLFLIVFTSLTLMLILENPLLSQINIYYSSVSYSSTQPTLNDGLFIQGSSIFMQNTLTYINQTSNTVIGYKTNFTIFNFGSLLICFLPLIVYLYFSNIDNKVKLKTEVKHKKV